MTAAPGRGGHSPPQPCLLLSSGVQVDAVVLESPYTNIRDAAANIPLTKVSPAVTGRGLCPQGPPVVAALAPCVSPWAGEGCSNQSHDLAPPKLSPW